MFGDLFGNLEEKQAAMREKMAGIKVNANAGDGAITVTANANGEILNIAIDKEKIDLSETEELEDLLLVAINRVLDEAAEIEAQATQESIKDMLPPGMGNLGGMFGG